MKKIKRWLSGMLAVCVILSALPAGADAASKAIPGITIELRQVTGTATAEISILAGADSFLAAQTVLEYDIGKLYPIQWGAEAEAVAIPADGADWTAATAAKTMAPGGVAGKPSLVYQTEAGKGYLYLGAESLRDPLTGADAKDGAVVTVRFGLTPAAMSELAEANEQKLLDWVTLAPAERCVSAPSGYPATLTPTLEKSYVYTESAMTDDRLTPMAKPEITAMSGLSRYADAKLEKGGCVVTFFDWDGSVIDAISGEGDMSTAVAALTGTSAALIKKAGYDFDTWLTVTSDSEGLHTAYGTLTSSKSGITAENRDIADFSNVQSNLLVQAAYKTNTGVNSGQGADGSLTEDTARYVIGAPTFYQYGISPDKTNGQYAVRCTVDRSSVLRADKPTVLAMVYVGSGSNMKAVTVKVDLDSTDSTSFEVVVPKATTNITFTVLDTYGVTAWTMGTSRSKEGSAANSEIVKGGSFALLVDEAWTAAQGGGWTSYINVQCFQDAGYSKVSTSNLDAAKTAIADASKAAGGKLDRASADAALAAYR